MSDDELKGFHEFMCDADAESYYAFDDEDFECPRCQGTGEAPDNGTNMGECEDCEGTGVIRCD